MRAAAPPAHARSPSPTMLTGSLRRAASALTRPLVAGPPRPPLNRTLAAAVPASGGVTTADAAAPKGGGNNNKKGGGGGGKGGGGKKGGGGGAASELAVTPKSVDFSRWYLDVVRDAELADYGPVRGTMVIRPYGYAIWERIQGWLDAEFKAAGVQNAYFPSLIPMSFLAREAAHVEGFAPELAVVTAGGGKDLDEPLAVRPTSETVVNHMFAQWVRSRRDLPLLVNQWCNVVRWEMRTRPFVRTTEFLWQEGHTAHATAAEATATARAFVELYARFARDVAAIPVVVGRKSRVESFAGADTTFTIEAMMGDGRALQAGTSHDLGDNFARAFGTRFAGGGEGGGGQQEGEGDGAGGGGGGLSYVHQTSWGVSTRMVGGVIMAHGDDAGARLPPALAPVQVVIVPIFKKGADPGAVLAAADALAAGCAAAGVRAKVDASQDKTPGWKYAHWEVKGVPLRAEVGPRDVEAGRCAVSRRDLPRDAGGRVEGGLPLEPAAFAAGVKSLLDDVQASLLSQATAFRDSRIVDVASYDELKDAVAAGLWARGWWAGSDADEARVKEETSATLRCFPFDAPAAGGGACFMTGAAGGEVAVFAKSY